MHEAVQRAKLESLKVNRHMKTELNALRMDGKATVKNLEAAETFVFIRDIVEPVLVAIYRLSVFHRTQS